MTSLLWGELMLVGIPGLLRGSYEWHNQRIICINVWGPFYILRLVTLVCAYMCYQEQRAKFKTESAMNDSANLGLSIISSCGKVKLNCKNKELVIYREYISRLSHKIDIDNPLLFWNNNFREMFLGKLVYFKVHGCLSWPDLEIKWYFQGKCVTIFLKC